MKPKHPLKGWKYTLKSTSRRRIALNSRPKSWGVNRKYLSVARALMMLSNNLPLAKASRIAKVDANYFYLKYKKK